MTCRVSRGGRLRAPASRLLALAFLVLAGPAAASEPEIAEALQTLKPLVQVEGRAYPGVPIETLMREQKVPAVSVAFIDDGRIAWAHAWGVADAASGRPATPETLFQAGSMSKPVAATLALDLVEDGILALDGPVNARLTSWKVPDNAFTETTPVTLRQLLSHSAGLTVHGFPGYPAGAPLPSVPQVLSGAAPANTRPVVVDQTPGSAFRYSGGGITVAQLLVVDATGRPFADLAQERVLGPLGMTASTYAQPLPEPLHDRAALAHGNDGAPVEGGWRVYPEQAAAGLWTTPSDLARFLIALEDALAGRAEPVLSRATAAQMLTPGLGGYGLGVGVTGQGEGLRLHHTGSNKGFHGLMVIYPNRRQGLVVMTNGDRGLNVVGPVLAAVAARYGWGETGLETKVLKPVAAPRTDLEALAGRYVRDDLAVTVAVGADGRTLRVAVPGSELELVPLGEDRFADTVRGSPVRFLRGPGGSVTGVEAGGRVLQRAP